MDANGNGAADARTAAAERRAPATDAGSLA